MDYKWFLLKITQQLYIDSCATLTDSTQCRNQSHPPLLAVTFSITNLKDFLLSLPLIKLPITGNLLHTNYFFVNIVSFCNVFEDILRNSNPNLS